MSFKKSYYLSLIIVGLVVVSLSLITLIQKDTKQQGQDISQFNKHFKALKTEALSHHKEAYNELHLKIDSLIKDFDHLDIKQKVYQELTELALQKNDSHLLYKYNGLSLNLAKKYKDTIAIGLSHWDYAAFFLKHQKYGDAFKHYQKAQKAFSENRHPYYEAKMWYNMAFIKGRLKEYTESEAFIYKALPYLRDAQKHKQVYRCYTLLSFIYEDLEGLDVAIKYLSLALETIQNKELPYLEAATLNNLGLIYHKKKSFQKALNYFNEALSIDDLKQVKPSLYARLLDNRAYTSFTHGEQKYQSDFEKALEIRKALSNKAGVILSQIHLAEIHWKKKDTTQAIQYAKEAVKRAQDINLKRELLNGLLLLAKFEPHMADQHMNTWKVTHDEIDHKLRKQRHKVAIVQFKTQEIKGEAERLKIHKQLLVLALTLGALLSLTFYLYIRQKNKIKRIKYQRRQEYQLQLKKEEERNRIAADLHDSILGKLFGLRIHWGLLDFKNSLNAENEHRKHLNTLSQLEKDIRDVAHDLKKQNKDIDLASQLENIGRVKSQVGAFDLTYKAQDQEIGKDLTLFIKKHLLAITEEVMQNVIKHAQATHVSIEIKKTKDTIHLIISDDGKGFKTKRRRKGIGLDNMKRRAEQINAKLNIKSKPGKGTTIVIKLKES